MHPAPLPYTGTFSYVLPVTTTFWENSEVSPISGTVAVRLVLVAVALTSSPTTSALEVVVQVKVALPPASVVTVVSCAKKTSPSPWLVLSVSASKHWMV